MSVTEESVRISPKLSTERVGCRAFLTATQADLTSSTPIKVTLDAVTYDLGVSFASNKFTVPVAGLYRIIGQVTYLAASVQADKIYRALIYKNNAEISEGGGQASVADTVSALAVDEVYLKKNDYIELYAWTSGTGNSVDIMGDASGKYTYLIVKLLEKEAMRQ